MPDEKRMELLRLLDQNKSIKEAAKEIEINYENAKAIYRIWRRERRSKLTTRWANHRNHHTVSTSYPAEENKANAVESNVYS